MLEVRLSIINKALDYSRFDGNNSSEIEFDSNYSHNRAGQNIGNYFGKPFVVGEGHALDNWNSYTEIMYTKAFKWEVEAIYPFADR